jgi:transposase
MIKRRKHYTEEFKLEALRLVKESGRTQEEIAGDLGIGKSTLGKWLRHYREEDLLSGPHEDVEKELKRLRRENELLRQERDLLKKATAFFAKETSR